MIIRHLRRHSLAANEGWWIIRCDCGWEGRTPDMARNREQIDASLEQLYREHLPAGEARAHLLVDSRKPDNFLSLECFLEDEHLTDAEARAAYAAQPPIVGVFVMPIGEPVTLLSDRIDDGVHHGSYRTLDGEIAELPIGEIRTIEGRVFRLGE